MWMTLQESWFLVVNRFAQATPVLHRPMSLYAHYGVGLFAAVLVLSWWWARQQELPRVMAAALWAPVGALLAIGVNQPLVHLVSEARPYSVLPQALVLVARSSDASFPSDHAVMAGAVAMGVWITNHRLGYVSAIAALLMGLARVYVGAHFPLDVVVGLLLGAAVSAAGFAVLQRLLVASVATLTHTPLHFFLTRSPHRVAP
jgi:undecaprenyl-diphosphatase